MWKRSLLAVTLVACSSTSASIPATTTDASAGDDGGVESSDAGIADVTAARDGSSKGSGGLTCTRREDLGNGRSACVTTVGSVELKIADPIATGPLRLAIYLHGDGAAAHKSNSALKVMIGFTDTHDGLAVSALAPNGCSWWQTPTWSCTATTNDPDTSALNAAALAKAFDALRGAYDVRDDAVFYYGSSGGSIFLTDEWLPLHADRYPGAYALNCGGEQPAIPFSWDTTNAALRDPSHLSFTWGDQDPLAFDIQRAVTFFDKRAFAHDETVVPDAGHCAFDGHARAVAVWTAYVR